MHYVCVKSVLERIKPVDACLYYEFEPSGPWWEITKPMLATVQVQSPRHVFDRPLAHAAHRADVFRLRKLIEDGGIYLDTDVLVTRSFDSLLTSSCVLGHEGGDNTGLCNAVILAEPEAPFLRRWYESYHSFRSSGHDSYWNEHSVLLPKMLAAKYPHELTVLDHKAFFWPLWTPEHLKWMFASTRDMQAPEAFAHHLWESRAWVQYLENLTVPEVRSIDTNFHRLITPLLEGIPDGFGAVSWQSWTRTRTRRAMLRARELKNKLSQ